LWVTLKKFCVFIGGLVIALIIVPLEICKRAQHHFWSGSPGNPSATTNFVGHKFHTAISAQTKFTVGVITMGVVGATVVGSGIGVPLAARALGRVTPSNGFVNPCQPRFSGVDVAINGTIGSVAVEWGAMNYSQAGVSVQAQVFDMTKPGDFHVEFTGEPANLFIIRYARNLDHTFTAL
jgi:hypothetical protein